MKVVHCRDSPYDIYIGRGSIWGNPFVIDKDGSRDEVIQKYHNWLLSSTEAIKLREQIHTLKGKILGCWCKPKRCHGDILVEIANSASLSEFFE